jgi:hypothetical protein
MNILQRFLGYIHPPSIQEQQETPAEILRSSDSADLPGDGAFLPGSNTGSQYDTGIFPQPYCDIDSHAGRGPGCHLGCFGGLGRIPLFYLNAVTVTPAPD